MENMKYHGRGKLETFDPNCIFEGNFADGKLE
jgi:hypothetical protein